MLYRNVMLCYTIMWTNATIQRHEPRKLVYRVCWQCYNSREKSSFLLTLQPVCSSKGLERISIESSLYTSWKTISENPVYQGLILRCPQLCITWPYGKDVRKQWSSNLHLWNLSGTDPSYMSEMTVWV